MATSSIQAYGGSAMAGTGVRPEDIHPLETYSGSTQTNTYDPLAGDTWHIRRLFVTIDGVPTFTYAPLGASDQFLEVYNSKTTIYECTEPSWANIPTMFGSIITGHDVIVRQLLSDGVTYKEWKLISYVNKTESPARQSVVFGLVDGFTVEKVTFDSTDNFANFTVSDFTTTIPPRATIAEPYSPSDVGNYHKGTLVYYEDGIYACKTDNPSNHWEASEWDSTTVAAEIEKHPVEIFTCTEPSWPSPADMYEAYEKGENVEIVRQSFSGVNYSVWRLASAVKDTGSPKNYTLEFQNDEGSETSNHKANRVKFYSTDKSTWTTTETTFVYPEQATIAPNWSSFDVSNYKKGTLVYRAGVLYRCKTNSPSSSWVASEWDETDISKEIARILGEQNMVLKHLKTNNVVSYELTGSAATATITLPADKALSTARLDNGGAKNTFISAAVDNVIKKAKISLGGAGKVLSRVQLSGMISIDVKIDSSESQSGTDVLISSILLKIGEWGEWEEKNIPIDFSSVTTESWSSFYRDSKPVRLVIDHTVTEFTIEDFNIQEDFVGESLDIFIELGIEADKTTTSNGTELID